MFDANMRYLPKGKEFFAEFRGVSDDHPFKKYSERHNVILCQMLSDEHENPTVRFFADGECFDLSDEDCGLKTWMAYAGCKDGRGFINNKIKNEAMKILGAEAPNMHD